MKITIDTSVNAPLKKVWDCWTKPEHIVHWNFASADWHCPAATNDLAAGGDFNYRMEARDGSVGFDFSGTYDEVVKHELITYHMSDGRGVKIKFKPMAGSVRVSESFDAEGTHSDEYQRAGWQAILENFKKYVEGNH